MVEAASSSNSTVNVLTVPGVLVIDIAKGFSMQSLYDGLINQYSSSTYTILGIDIPLIGIDCLIYKNVDPTFDIKEAIVRLFNYLSKLILKPVWEILEALAKAINAVLGDILELPVFGLKIQDLFRDDIWQVIEEKVKNLWENAKDELIAILKTLGIPWPFFEGLDDPELSIRKIAKDIAANLVGFIFKAISKIIAAIKTALRIFDLSTYEKLVWSEIWQQAVDAILGSILNRLAIPVTLDELYKLLIDLAKETFDLPFVTFQELMAVIEKFQLPPFGSPLDWKLPINLKIEFPEKDFSKIISDMIVWFNNFLVNILKKFIEAVTSILEFFGINISFLTEVKIPISLCVVENAQIN